MSKAIEMIGKHFGSLTVIAKAPRLNTNRRYWLCRCDCGNEIVVEGGNLRSGHTKTCRNCSKYISIDPATTKCILASGKSFIFDTENLALVKQYKWCIEASGYVHSMGNKNLKHPIRLHQLLLGFPAFCVDHINGDRTDNRKCNLRIATNAQNCYNSRLSCHNTTGYKGVSFDKRRSLYEASITYNGCKKFLGYCHTPEEAARKYDAAALLLFGEFARTNKEVYNEPILELGA